GDVDLAEVREGRLLTLGDLGATRLVHRGDRLGERGVDVRQEGAEVGGSVPAELGDALLERVDLGVGGGVRDLATGEGGAGGLGALGERGAGALVEVGAGLLLGGLLGGGGGRGLVVGAGAGAATGETEQQDGGKDESTCHVPDGKPAGGLGASSFPRGAQPPSSGSSRVLEDHPVRERDPSRSESSVTRGPRAAA